MKRLFLLLIVFGLVAGALYASPPDPGGFVGSGVVMEPVAFTAPLEAQGLAVGSYVDQYTVQKGVVFMASLAALGISLLLLSIIVAPFLTFSRSTVRDGPAVVELAKETKSPVLK